VLKNDTVFPNGDSDSVHSERRCSMGLAPPTVIYCKTTTSAAERFCTMSPPDEPVSLILAETHICTMHICHARHYSTLRNVHYRKRRGRNSTFDSRNPTRLNHIHSVALLQERYLKVNGEWGFLAPVAA